MIAGTKILVTGGTGYIGSHTVVELINSGYQPVIVDNLSNSSLQVLKQIEGITGVNPEFFNFDLSDKQRIDNLRKIHPDIEGIIHFAAFKAVGESVEQPLKYYRNNIYPLVNLLDSFSEQKVNFVFSSSCTVYGEPDQLPVTESSPVKPAESPYGNTKQIAEDILRDTAKATHNLRVTALRYFNPVGAHASALIGELPIGVPQNLVPFITQSAIGKRGAITVFGNDYNTPDGSCIRDYIHVVDLAKAHIAALKNMENTAQGKTYDVYNVGTGNGNTVLEIIKAFESTTGVKLNYTIGARRSGDIEKIYGDVNKAEKELGWKAELGLPEMMSSAWAWENYIKQHPF
ncbi:UDP-glucose 4-epimerase GalE [Daejeonella lutea]|uniref:UDP-glucose 4-epimerase n=1 Tax=Daejeonella lutea TaxID=572036 RepID=A0A1T5FF11_9SPHI|nr:UDP-glucose 4-epimerase GalE [Daejeonella lutea]SKB94784.1 UDP-glucose 4-epimerase [Daejeonella lutea]